MDILIRSELAGLTVLQVVKRYTAISSAHLKKLKFSDTGITVCGERVTVRRVLKEGEVLSLATEDEESGESAKPVDLSLEIVYEDENCAVPSKPADMPTHPSHDHYDDTVANALAFKYEKEGRPFVFRPVNRLDRNTSGLLIVAKNRPAASFLSKAMKNGEIKKVYLAILAGVPKESAGLIETYMRRTADSVIVRENCGEHEGGDYAMTAYKVLCSENGHSLVAALPITGRTHQLRVHFSGMDCPILGDDMYGEPSTLIGRHALHSTALRFPLPFGEEKITLFSPLPEDMKKAAESLFPTLVCDDMLLAAVELLDNTLYKKGMIDNEQRDRNKK